MSKTVKFEDLSKEDQQKVKSAGKKLFFKGLLTGANYGGLLFFSNLVIVMANEAFLKSTPLMFILCVAVDITLLRMMGTANRENAAEFANSIKEVLEKHK